MQQQLAQELSCALSVSALRASHRAMTLRAFSAKVTERAGGSGTIRNGSTALIERARLFRSEALKLVKRQEIGYRYPLQLLVGQRNSLTAYSFGYLYPASTLFFWEREEQQVEQGRFDPLFMNLWDVRRTLGLESLFFQ
jgi:hypothetical protein